MTKNLNKIYDLVKRAKAENRDITEEELQELQDDTPKECKEEKSDEDVDTPKEDDEIPSDRVLKHLLMMTLKKMI